MCCRMDGCNARLTALSATFFYFYTQKCDEQRVGDSCQTCIRLRIDCLGWGPKRPAWMRVSTYIAKSSLTFLSPYGAFHFCVARGRAQPCLILPRPATLCSGYEMWSLARKRPHRRDSISPRLTREILREMLPAIFAPARSSFPHSTLFPLRPPLYSHYITNQFDHIADAFLVLRCGHGLSSSFPRVRCPAPRLDSARRRAVARRCVEGPDAVSGAASVNFACVYALLMCKKLVMLTPSFYAG